MGPAGFAEAEQVYQAALAQSPDEDDIKVGLAGVFHHQHKPSAALVIIDELLKQADPPPPALLLAARLYVQAGAHEQAAEFYRRALERKPALADADPGVLLAEVEEDLDEEEWGDRMAAPVEEIPELPLFELETSRISFENVGGMDRVKDEIRMKIIHPLSSPELYQAYGKAVGGGLLMFGPRDSRRGEGLLYLHRYPRHAGHVDRQQ